MLATWERAWDSQVIAGSVPSSRMQPMVYSLYCPPDFPSIMSTKSVERGMDCGVVSAFSTSNQPRPPLRRGIGNHKAGGGSPKLCYVCRRTNFAVELCTLW